MAIIFVASSIVVLWPYIDEMIKQIKYDLRMSYYNPKWTNNVHGKNHKASNFDNGGKW